MVVFEILHLFMSLWAFVSVETRGLGGAPAGSVWGADPSQAKKVITELIYFKTVLFTTSDVNWKARMSCFFFHKLNIKCLSKPFWIPHSYYKYVFRLNDDKLPEVCVLPWKKILHHSVFDSLTLTNLCVGLDFCLYSDENLERFVWDIKKSCSSYNVFFWTLLHMLSDWRI